MTDLRRAAPDDFEQLGEMISGIRVAMLTTREPGGRLVSRPLFTREQTFDGTLRFFTADDSAKVEQLEAEPQVNLAYADPEHQRYVSIAGQARVVRDRARITALWNDRFDRLYFKQGVDDPHLVLLEVRVDTAEVWNAGDNALSRAWHFAAAMLTGDGERLGEHQRVDLRH